MLLTKNTVKYRQIKNTDFSGDSLTPEKNIAMKT